MAITSTNAIAIHLRQATRLSRVRTGSVVLVPGITNRYCGPSFETATEPVIGRAFARPVGDLLRMRSNSLKHNNLMLRSERRERLEAWAASDSPISHSRYYGALTPRHRPNRHGRYHRAPGGFISGTLSIPEVPHGWHRKNRASVIHPPPH